MENNYSVYQHVTPDGMYYFGQTQNVEKRWSNNGSLYKRTALQPYIEKFGWDNIQHIVLFREQTKENALWIEDFLIETAREDGVCINKNRSGLVSKEEGYSQEYYEQNKDKFKEYYEQNKDKIREYQQEYCQKNKDKKQDYDKQYYEQNKDKKLKYQQEYYEQNKEQIREQQKQYQEQNKDKIKEYRQQYYEQNKQQKREYQRKYYQRKKEENQFKEFGYIPLF